MKKVLSPVPVAVVCALLALVVLLAYGLVQNEPDRNVEESLARGELEQAPAVELPALDGNGRGALADYRGQVVVLNIWASWCKPCREESPLLEKWHRRMRTGGGTVLGVDVLDVTADAQEFIDQYGLSYPMLKDKDGATLESFGVVAYPETFVIDREGIIRHMFSSQLDPTRHVEEALKVIRQITPAAA